MTASHAEYPAETISMGAAGTISIILLVSGVVLATLTDAIASTVLSFGRLDMLGDIHATPDEFSRLDFGYTAAKLSMFLLAPWLMGRLSAPSCLRAATGAMTLACGLAALTTDIDLLLALRIFQGMMGAVLLVSGQAMLLQAFSRGKQPLVQSLFALGPVVTPATLAPSMQGWMVDSLSWTWIYLATVPAGLAALGLLAIAKLDYSIQVRKARFDWIGTSLFTIAAFSLTYVLSQGSRWYWFEEPFVVWLTVIGGAALVLFSVQQYRDQGHGALVDLSVFQNDGFAFGFLVSFVAGVALFGSAYLIPTFAISVLGMTATDAGMLLLPSGAVFMATLLLTAFLVQRVGVPPFATVPFGILMFMASMWMLSRSSDQSGSADMMPAIVLRGFGIGFLFLSATLIALTDLRRPLVAYGIGLFNVGRQIGALVGVAFLATFIDRQTALNRSVLATHIVPGRNAVSDYLATISTSLTERGMEAGAAAQVAIQMLGREVATQATIIAFNSAFLSIAFFFLMAAPFIISAKIILSKFLIARSPPQ